MKEREKGRKGEREAGEVRQETRHWKLATVNWQLVSANPRCF